MTRNSLKTTMGKQTSIDVREIIVDLHKKGKSLREISQIVGRNHCTVKKILDKFAKHKTLENLPRGRRPKRLTDTEVRAIVRGVKADPTYSAVKIAENLSQSSGKSVSASTVRRALHQNGLYGRVPRKKPYVSKINQTKRLNFAKKYVKQPTSFWSNILFTDESKYEVFGVKKPPKIWRSKNEAFSDKNVIKTVKHGGGSVMVWGCMAASGVGNLVFIESTMKKEDYLNILSHNVAPSVEKLSLPQNWIFQQDNDPKHTSKIVKEWLLYRTPKTLDHPPQSPDLNPIEHLWDYLDKKVRERSISSKDDLKVALQDEWSKIPPEYTKKLIESMPRRLEAVIKSKGRQTKY